jgi:FtsZ-interacting cell division protein ZipA
MEKNIRLIIGLFLVIFAAVVFWLIFGIAGLVAVIIIIIVTLWYSNKNKKKLLKS